MKIFFCLAFLACLFCVTISAQAPVLVDEIGSTPCEDFASRIDGWIQEAKSRPELIPHAIVSGPGADLLKRITYREWIKGQLAWRFENGSDRERFRIHEGKATPQPKVELLLAQPVDSFFQNRVERWDLSLRVKRSEAYYQSFGDGGICPHIDHASIFKQFIAANPKLRGRVVLHETKASRFLAKKTESLADLPASVSADRFKFVRPARSATL